MNADSTVTEVTNWAEVADRALDMGQSAIVTMTEAIKGIAPEVWELLMKQVYAEAITSLVTCVFILSVGLGFLFPSLRSGAKRDWDDGPYIGGIVAGVVATLFGFVATCIGGQEAVRMLINPEYYAIQKFMAIASGAGL